MCKSLSARLHRYYLRGEWGSAAEDCAHWKECKEDCLKWRKQQDEEALVNDAFLAAAAFAVIAIVLLMPPLSIA